MSNIEIYILNKIERRKLKEVFNNKSPKLNCLNFLKYNLEIKNKTKTVE